MATAISLAFACALLLTASTSAFAASPWWHLTSGLRPAVIEPGGEGTMVVHALNVGDAPTSGPVTLSLTLPVGMTVKTSKKGVPQVFFKGPLQSPFGTELGPTGPNAGLELCKVSSTQVSCATNPENAEFSFLSHINPYEELEIQVGIKDAGAAEPARYEASISGGEAPAASIQHALPIEEAPVPFAAEELSLVPEEEGGAVDARAGSHPFQLTVGFSFNQTADPEHPPALPKNLYFKLPPGQLGNVTVTSKCTSQQFATMLLGDVNLCPSNSALGVASVTFYEPANLGLITVTVPLFNLEAKYGEPARFGFVILGTPVILDTSLRSGPGEDYGVTVSTINTTEVINFLSSTVTFWGVPADSRHDQSRGWGCLAGGHYAVENKEDQLTCDPSSEVKPPSFLTMPTDCGEAYAFGITGTSWATSERPGAVALAPLDYSLLDGSGDPLGLIGCNQVPFAPSVEAEPTTDRASAPSGLNVNIDFHDEGLTSSEGLAQSQLEKTVVTLPEGLTINPSAGVGLAGCTPADYARESATSAPGAGCPNNSKLGTVEIETPLLTQTIHGSLYIAQPYENPFSEPGHPSGSLVAIYIVAKNPETGVLIKLAGKVAPNPITGQLVTTFENTPQLPFSHFNFHFREGQQAPLITPAACGNYTTEAQLTPWSEPLESLAETSSFTVTKGYDGGACPSGGIPPFQPQITAGMLNNNAGAFSPFYLHLTRTDAEGEIGSFSTDLPSGLTGDLSGIPFCPEAAIALARTKTGAQEEAEPSCPAASQIGHTLVGTGVGAVLAYVPGKLYLAGPYDGDPFSLVSVTSAVVGPFDLGTVVLRFALRVDPTTAQVSIDPTASEPIPHIIRGIVTHVRDIRVYVDRPNFILNPTSCAPLAISSTLASNSGQSTTISSRFQDSNCRALGFGPKFTVATSGHTSRSEGASLDAKISYPAGAMGTQANIASVKVKLPRQLPSRLSTLQKACPDKVFNINPANCPAESRVGTATTTTPIIPVPLNGPVYFVSHAAEKFPELIIVLSGYGVTVDLHGETFISKTGITSTTFKTVPDVPVGSFELKLPQGKYSALAANGNLCKQKLLMPTRIVAQNGDVINQSTKIAATGCAKHKAAKKAPKHKKKK
jgi:hypothetical protein